MKTNIDEGRIVKALAGFYYIDDGHEVHQCRARGKFRKQDIKPVVGDFVEFQKGNHDDGYLLKILERKNVLRRPPIANIDQALLVFSRKEPDFSTVLLSSILSPQLLILKFFKHTEQWKKKKKEPIYS